ncbi:MAG: PCMD domain-containing protein, partial [Odoribacter sp.]|nr:PCMD domain-containing protein [Odoribacter sp.]
VLTGTTAEVKTAVNGAGITWTPEDASDKQEAQIDFSGLANRLPLGEYEFYVSVYDAACHLVSDTLRISVMPDIDHIADEVNVMDVWAKFATIRGRWYTATRPEGLALEYSADGNQWTRATTLIFNEEAKTFSASLTGLEPATTYYYRTTSTESGASETIREFTTERAEQVPYLNFDIWFKDGKTWYLGEASNRIWDSGNQGANTVSEKNPTAPDETDKVDLPGNKASAYLETKAIFGVMAAGNLYTGSYKETVGTKGARLNFGIPYTLRPTVLKGYYKYQPKPIDKTKSPYDHLMGKTDSCYIYVALFDWNDTFTVDNSINPPHLIDLSTALAFGELKTDRQMDAFEPFEIKIKYQDLTKRPTYILIVASASKYGDYFTGGVGSKLWIDEFELGFDPVE